MGLVSRTSAAGVPRIVFSELLELRNSTRRPAGAAPVAELEHLQEKRLRGHAATVAPLLCSPSLRSRYSQRQTLLIGKYQQKSWGRYMFARVAEYQCILGFDVGAFSMLIGGFAAAGALLLLLI